MKPWFLCGLIFFRNDLVSTLTTFISKFINAYWHERGSERDDWVGGWIKRRKRMKESGSFLRVNCPDVFNNITWSIQDDVLSRKDGQHTDIWLLYEIQLLSNITVEGATNLGMDGVEKCPLPLPHTRAERRAEETQVTSLLKIKYTVTLHLATNVAHYTCTAWLGLQI